MHNTVKIWLYVGVFMVFVQIVIGGITRLTGSGLSITKWEIVTGTLPPMSEKAWIEEFDLYKETPQYLKVNQGMDLKEFKFIYFWEYFHRLWARSIGLVFFFPFLWFVFKKKIEPPLLTQLIVLVLLGAIVASFGWIMVVSGLVERPWVNAYKLTIHLGLGIILFLYITYIAVNYTKGPGDIIIRGISKFHMKFLLGTLFVQILLGGLMSGMKACLFYPTWPKIGSMWVPEVLTDSNNWRMLHLTDYDTYAFAPALVQFLHRGLAYFASLLIIYITVKFWKTTNPIGKTWLKFSLGMVLIQVILGILTLINCLGQIPLWYGVIHQGFAMLLLAVVLVGIIMRKNEMTK